MNKRRYYHYGKGIGIGIGIGISSYLNEKKLDGNESPHTPAIKWKYTKKEHNHLRKCSRLIQVCSRYVHVFSQTQM